MKGKLASNPMIMSDASAGDESELEEGEISDDIEIIKEVNRHTKHHHVDVGKPSSTIQKILPSSDSKRPPVSATKRPSHSSKKSEQSLDSKRPRLSEVNGGNGISSSVKGSGREQRRDSSASKTKSRESSQSRSRHSSSVKQVQSSHSRSSRQELPRSAYPANEKSLSRSASNNTHPKDSFSSSQSSRGNSKQESCKKLPNTSTDRRVSTESVGSVEKSSIAKESEKKWIPICESGTESRCSVESMDIDSPSEDEDELDLRLRALHSVVSVEDEELGLRLAALHSVVSNGSCKVKEAPIEDPASKQSPNSERPPLPEASPSLAVDKSQDEEDDDEELLRAELLIAVALKQTKELEMKTQTDVQQPEPVVVIQPTQVPLVKTSPLPPPLPPIKLTAPTLTRKQVPLVIPKADRLVINLQEDSSSDEEYGDEDNVVNSITALLKSARQTVEQKDAASTQGAPFAAVAQDMSLLPQNKQEEYQRLKMELNRRENMRLQQQQPTTSPTSSRNLMLTQSQSDNIPKKSSDHQTVDDPSIIVPPSSEMPSSLPAAPVRANTNPVAISADSHQGSSVVLKTVVHISSPENGAKENRLAKNSSVIQKSSSVSSVSNLPTQSSAPVKSPLVKPAESAASVAKMAVIKEQLAKKKRDHSSTKEALKKQLELVDNSRSLWVKSSQEVSRLKALLQVAEETEKQHLSQLTRHTEQTQRLKTKMQTVEKQIIILHKGLGSNRPRRISSKLRSKPIQSPGPSLSAPEKNLMPATSALRVKPRIVTKALANRDHLTTLSYPKINALAVTSAATSSPSGQASVTNDKRLIQHDEKWLFGTLGDETDGVTATSFPAWSPQGHATVISAKDKFRVDPSLIICHKHLLDSSSCRDSNCGLQHLPLEEASTPPVLDDSKAEQAGSKDEGNKLPMDN